MLSGCATTAKLPKKPDVPGFYYYVQKGDSLYRLAKDYDIDLELLAKLNRISDTTKIETGERIFIPKTDQSKKRKPETTQATNLSKNSFIWPTKGKVISYFNQKSQKTTNKGIDIKTNVGQEIMAAKDGKVSFCGELLKNQGSTIIIEHNEGISTVYSRVAEVFIKPGDRVDKGQVIARAAITGRENIAYLHFEVRNGSNAKNPLYYLP